MGERVGDSRVDGAQDVLGGLKRFPSEVSGNHRVTATGQVVPATIGVGH